MKKIPEYHIQGIRHQSLTIALQLLATSLPVEAKKNMIDKVNKYDKEVPKISDHPLDIALREQLEEIKYLLSIPPSESE